MRHFRHYCRDKLATPEFRELFDEECHVCRFTIRIFEEMDRRGVSVAHTADQLQTNPEEIQRLMDADYCDPRLTIRLCRHFGLPAPNTCSRLVGTS